MTDKLRKTFPLRITFSDGEQPTGAKLSAISEQTRNGLGLVELAIGDLWNHSGDNILVDYPLQTPNLARLLGQNQFLNPALYPVENEFTFREQIDTKFADQTTGYLTFKPKTGTTPVGTGTVFVNPVGEEWEVGRSLPTEYWVSDETGKFRTDVEVGGGGSDYLTYYVEPDVDWFAGAENFPGVIPDFRQAEFTSCRIEQAGGRFFLHLPPRMPLDFNATGYELPESEPIKYPASEDISNSYNRATTTATPFKLWQAYVDGSTLALRHQHYRYSLPKEIREAYSGLNPGDEYPSGFMWLWDKSLGHVLDGIIFKVPEVTYISDPWVIQISSDIVDLSTYVAAGDDESEDSYNFSNIVLITCGSPVARSVWSLFASAMNHTHSNEGHHSAILSHDNLLHVDPPIATNNEHSARYPTHLPRWPASAWNNDDHVSLLSRGGSQGTADARRRDLNDNAMLGHLVLADQDDGGTGIFLDDTPDNTWRLYFGAVGGPSFHATTGDGIILSDRLYMGADTNGWVTDDGGTIRAESPNEVVLSLKTEGQTQVWDLEVEDSPWDTNEMFSIIRRGGTSMFHITPDDSIYLGTSPDIGQPGVPLVIGTTDTNHIQLFANGPGSQVMSIHAGSYRHGWISCATNFNDSDNEGGWLYLGGQDGVSLRYGNAGSGSFISNWGTVGAYLDSVGDFYCNNNVNITDNLTVNGWASINNSGSPELNLYTTATSGQQATIYLKGARTGVAATLGSIQAQNNETAGDGQTHSEIRFIKGSVANSSAIDFYTSNGGAQTLSVRFDSGGQVYMNGPLLNVVGSIRARGGAPGALGVNYNGFGFNSPGDNDSGMYSEADGEVNFYTNAVERMRLDSKATVFGANSTSIEFDASASTSGYTGSIVLNDTGMFIQNSSSSRPIYLATARGNALIVNTDAANDMLMYSEMSADRELGHTSYPWTKIYVENPDELIVPNGSSYYESCKKMFANNGAVYSASGLSYSYPDNPGSYSCNSIRIYGSGGNAHFYTTLPGPNARGRFRRAGVTYYPVTASGDDYFYMKIWYREYDSAIMYQLGSTSGARYPGSSVETTSHDADAGYANADALYLLEIEYYTTATTSIYFLSAFSSWQMYGFACGPSNA